MFLATKQDAERLTRPWISQFTLEVSFPRITKKNAPQLPRKGEVWGVTCPNKILGSFFSYCVQYCICIRPRYIESL